MTSMLSSSSKNFELPPLHMVRPAYVVHVYCFGDASGKQFGATLLQSYSCQQWLSEGKSMEAEGGTCFQVGLWMAQEEQESSNYKELRNLVDTVSCKARTGWLWDCKFFLFTDISTVEGCF
jgi:hypothetical protein